MSSTLLNEPSTSEPPATTTMATPPAPASTTANPSQSAPNTDAPPQTLASVENASMSPKAVTSALEVPPPSQALDDATPRIFVDSDGSAIPIFVEANGITNNRPRLVKNLKKHGANIVHDPAEARIILVEPNSKEGRFFVREWRDDDGKSVLDVAWANASIRNGRALLQNDQYGGLGDLTGEDTNDEEDVEAVVNESDGEPPGVIPVERRVTPAKPRMKIDKFASHAGFDDLLPGRAASSSNFPASKRHNLDYPKSPTPTSGISRDSDGQVGSPLVTGDRSPSVQGTRLRPSLSRRQSVSNSPGLPTPPSTSSNNFTRNSSSNGGAPYAALPPQQDVSMTFSQQQSQPFGPPPSQSYGMQPSTPQPYPHSQLVPQLQYTPMMFSDWMHQGTNNEMLQHLAAFNHLPPATQQTIVQQVLAVAQGRPLLAPPPSGFSAPSQASYWGSTTQVQQFDQYNPASLQNMAAHYNALIQPNTQQTPTAPYKNGFTDDVPASTQDRLLTPPPPSANSSTSFNRERLHTPPPSSFSLSSQELDNEPETPPNTNLERGTSKKKRSYEAMISEDRNEVAYAPVSSQQHKSKSKRSSKKRHLNNIQHEPSLPQSPAKQTPTTGIFTAEDGRPMKFHYQINMTDREGRRMADLSKIKANGGVITPEPREATFIILSARASENKSLKEDCRIMGTPGLKASFIDACLEEGRIVDVEDYTFENEEDTSASAKKVRRKAIGIPNELLASLPRPPEMVLLPNGNKYTSKEKQYVLDCAAIIYRSEPSVTLTRLFAIIAEAHPSHTANAWKNRASTHWNSDLQAIRRKVQREMRVEKSASTSNGSSQISNERPAADGEDEDEALKVSGTGTVGDDPPSDELETDFGHIISFFAEEPEGEDEELWGILTEKHPCLTARTWPEFYQIHLEVVNERLRSALGIDH